MKTRQETRINLGGVVKTKTVPDYDADGKKTGDHEEPVMAKDNPTEFVTEELTNILEKKANEIIAEHKTRQWPEPNILKGQTFIYTDFEQPDELASYITNVLPDDQKPKAKDVAVDVIQRGWVIRQQAVIRDFMLDPKQESQNDPYDLGPDAASPTERRKADPELKAFRAFKDMGIDVDMGTFRSLLQNMKAASATPAAVTPQEAEALAGASNGSQAPVAG